VAHNPKAEGGEVATAGPHVEVSNLNGRTEDTDAVQALIEDLLRTSLALSAALASLLEELPEHAFPARTMLPC
jgi:hypothetical protein